jgi:hypothetical protein
VEVNRYNRTLESIGHRCQPVGQAAGKQLEGKWSGKADRRVWNSSEHELHHYDHSTVKKAEGVQAQSWKDMIATTTATSFTLYPAHPQPTNPGHMAIMDSSTPADS